MVTRGGGGGGESGVTSAQVRMTEYPTDWFWQPTMETLKLK